MQRRSCSATALLCNAWAAAFLVLCILVGCYGIGLYAVTLTGAFPIGSRTPPLAVGLRSQPAAIFIHAFASGAALIACGMQITPVFRRWASARTHRLLGWAYVLCVVLGAASGAALSRTAVGGAVSSAGFACLATAWAATTGGAVYAIRTGRPALHARLMSHSAALCFAAVMLRIYLPAAIFAPRGISFESAYRVISWACWVPNVAAVEAWYWLGEGGRPAALLTSMPGVARKVGVVEGYAAVGEDGGGGTAPVSQPLRAEVLGLY